MVEVVMLDGAPQPEAIGDVYIDVAGLRKKVPVARVTIYMWMRDRGFPKPIKVGSKNMWKLSEVEEFLARHRRSP